MFFRDIIGQVDIKKKLLKDINEGHIAHAQLICGPEGTGKLPLAIAYARYILCNNPSSEDACGICPSCVKMNKLAHPDLHFAFPIVKKKGGKDIVCDDYIKDWREFVIQNPYFTPNLWSKEISAENSQPIIYAKESDEMVRKLSLKSCEGGYKVMIIWLPEKMHIVCANKLLKMLEEPPAKTLFMLVSENPDQILQTILSRTQRINIRNIENQFIAQALKDKFGVTEQDALNISHVSNGNFVHAIEAIHFNEEAKIFFEFFVSLMRLSYMRKLKEMKAWSEQVASLGREKQKNFLEYAQKMIRENFIFNFQNRELTYLNWDEQNFASKFAPFVNERNAVEIMENLALAQQHIEQNVNAKMVFFDFSLKMIVLLKQ